MDTITIADDIAEIVVVPDLGAGLASYDYLVGTGRHPVFRACRRLAEAEPFDLACNLLIPGSGRISGAGFAFGGRFHHLGPNLDGEPLPIHGNGFSSPWRS